MRSAKSVHRQPDFSGLPIYRFLREARLKRKGDIGRRRDTL